MIDFIFASVVCLVAAPVSAIFGMKFVLERARVRDLESELRDQLRRAAEADEPVAENIGETKK